jgi:hypothetical protein
MSFPFELRPLLALPLGPRVARLWDASAVLPRRRVALVLGGLALTLGVLRVGAAVREAADRPPVTLRPAAARVPASGFERNQGQADPEVEFLARGRGFAALLLPHEILLTTTAASRGAALSLRLEGASGRSRLVPADALPQHAHYRWSALDEGTTLVPTYGSVRYESAYPCVDLRLREEAGALRCSFIVDSGRSPAAIRLAIGPEAHVILSKGAALMNGRGARLRLGDVHAYQNLGTGVRTIETTLGVRAHGIEFEVGSYDVRAPLVIEALLTRTDVEG